MLRQPSAELHATKDDALRQIERDSPIFQNKKPRFVRKTPGSNASLSWLAWNVCAASRNSAVVSGLPVGVAKVQEPSALAFLIPLHWTRKHSWLLSVSQNITTRLSADLSIGAISPNYSLI